MIHDDDDGGDDLPATVPPFLLLLKTSATEGFLGRGAWNTTPKIRPGGW